MAQLVPLSLSAEEQLEQLLRQRRQAPQRRAEIDAEIRDRFLATRAIVVLDMADFSCRTQAQGIISTLEVIYTLRDVAIPTFTEHQGTVFKYDADNLYVAFNEPDAALIAAHQARGRLSAINIHTSMGIGYGEMLIIGDRDVYGHEMNLASKLGEDLAADDDILLTQATYMALQQKSDWAFASFTINLADLTIEVYRLQA